MNNEQKTDFRGSATDETEQTELPQELPAAAPRRNYGPFRLWADRFGLIGISFFGLAAVLSVGGVFGLLIKAADDTSEWNPPLLFAGAWGCFKFGAICYGICQLMHIRANTAK